MGMVKIDDEATNIIETIEDHFFKKTGFRPQKKEITKKALKMYAKSLEEDPWVRICKTCKKGVNDELDNRGRYYCDTHGAIAKSRTIARHEGKNVRTRM